MAKAYKQSKAGEDGATSQKPEVHGTIEEAAQGKAEEIVHSIPVRQGCNWNGLPASYVLRKDPHSRLPGAFLAKRYASPKFSLL